MNCPNPACTGTIKPTDIPNIGECQSCGMVSIQCLDFLDMKNKCNQWNYPTARSCRFCGTSKKPDQYEEAIKDYLKNTYFESLVELGKIEIDADLVKSANFNLYQAGAFFFLLGKDGSYAPIQNLNPKEIINTDGSYASIPKLDSQKSIELGRIGQGDGWKAYCLDHYAALFCPTQWRIIPHNLFSPQESNLPSACKWEANPGEETIPNQEPIIWDIPGKFTLVSWVTRSQSQGLKFYWRTITDQGKQHLDKTMVLSDFTSEKFFCWEKLSLLPLNPNKSTGGHNNPLELQIIIGCAKGFYALDFTKIGSSNPAEFEPTLNKLTSEEHSPFYFHSQFKELDRALFVEPFLPFHSSDPPIHEILACKKEMDGNISKEFVVGIPFPTNGRVNEYRSSPGMPLCLGDNLNFFTWGKKESGLVVIRKCTFNGQPQEIEETKENSSCLGSKFLRSFFLCWFINFDGKLHQMELKIFDLRKKGEQISNPNLTTPNVSGRMRIESSFISNPVVTHRGILFIMEKDNRLVLALLPFKERESPD